MLTWIAENTEVLNLAANVAMVVIWLAYLHVFLRSFRRQTRPKIVINLAAGSTLDAACFISNMSSDAIYIESVLVTVVTGGETLACTITDFGSSGGSAGDDPKQRTHQGPLASADYVSLGRFSDLLAAAARRKGRDPEALLASDETLGIEVTIIADYGSESMLVGARRRFRARRRDGDWRLSVETQESEQIRSQRERRRLYALLPAAE